MAEVENNLCHCTHSLEDTEHLRNPLHCPPWIIDTFLQAKVQTCDFVPRIVIFIFTRFAIRANIRVLCLNEWKISFEEIYIIRTINYISLIYHRYHCIHWNRYTSLNNDSQRINLPAKKEAAFIFVRHSRISSTWYSIHVIVKLACSVKVIRNYSREETNLLSLGFDQITERNDHEESRTTAAVRSEAIVDYFETESFEICRMFRFFFFFFFLKQDPILRSSDSQLLFCESQISA